MENSTAHAKKNESGMNTTTIVWVIVGLLILGAGFFAIKALFSPFSDYKLTLVDAPKEIPMGSVGTFTWRVDGSPTTITSTTVRLGAASNPGELTKETKPGDTSYTETLSDFANGKYNIPLQFVGNMKAPTATGTYYYRVHALINGKNYWSPEGLVEIKPADWKVSILNAPKTAIVGKVTTFTWRVEGPVTEIPSTSVYFGRTSTVGELAKTVDPQTTSYTTDMIKDFANGKYNVPLTFVGNIQIATAGSYFYRVHALVNGQHIWGPEGVIDVKVEPKGVVEKAPAVGQ